MIEKLNGIFYLILFSIHFLGLGFYAYQMIIDNKRYREKFQIDETAATIMRMTGAIFLGIPADFDNFFARAASPLPWTILFSTIASLSNPFSSVGEQGHH